MKKNGKKWIWIVLAAILIAVAIPIIIFREVIGDYLSGFFYYLKNII